jgi:glycosyltransferase involved in cell wall biosynthesis
MGKKVCLIHKVRVLDPRSFYKEGLSLLRAGYDTTIMGLYDKSRNVDGIKLIGFDLPDSRLKRFIVTNIQMFARALKEKADIYHFHDLDFIPSAILLKIITRKKVIYDVHEAYPEYMLLKTYIPGYLRKTISKLVAAMEFIGSRFFDAIVTNDNFVLENFSHKHKEVIYNYPLIDFFNYSQNNKPYEKREYDVVFIGSCPTWHFLPMLETCQLLKRRGRTMKWLLLPLVDNKSRELMMSQIKERGLSEYFIIPDPVPFKEVPAFLYNSRIGIITIPPFEKYLKNIPLKMFEYMGCGLPIIASNLPPARQFVDGQDCAILVKHDPSAYADAIVSLLNSPKKALDMGQRGKKLVFEQYNWNVEETKLLNLYKNLFND